MIHVAVLGYGTVGSGVVEVIETNKKDINKRAATELNIKYILDLRDFPGDPYEDKVVHDYNIILNDPEITVICETMGGLKPAYDFSKQALMAGKSVCTSNKELVANHGPELIRIARENHCNYLFEASVGGGIPIIRPLNYSLTAEKIDSITGILNGTTNYILTKMDKEGADFADVLKEAQEKGYAERNPEADVEGYDACRKIAILSSLMCGKNVKYEEIYTEGITKISAADFLYAKQMNKSVKLLAMSRDTEDGFFAMVAPFMISREHPLYCVNDVFNAIYVHGNMLGDSMYYGRGAGKLPTASAVVSDVVDCARHQGKTVMCFWENEDVKVEQIGNDKGKFFVRVAADRKDAAMEAFGSLAEINVGITEEFGFMTQVMTEKEFNDKIEKIGGCINRIRILSA
ncbi:MAG: homoserine dehydrogenase [Lachnospiraceae bacterium]|nr:homoserine dehydrogenase [Lachnospiraceae bacterium]MBD5523853.1 homoserine dehydrogenase [Lachnospiraceae bacterium]